jgi:hypothetical protein
MEAQYPEAVTFHNMSSQSAFRDHQPNCVTTNLAAGLNDMKMINTAWGLPGACIVPFVPTSVVAL